MQGSGATNDNQQSFGYRIGILTAAIAVVAVLMLLPSPEPLEKGGELIPLTWGRKATMVLLVAAIILWITEVIPFSVTAFPAVACVSISICLFA